MKFIKRRFGKFRNKRKYLENKGIFPSSSLWKEKNLTNLLPVFLFLEHAQRMKENFHDLLSRFSFNFPARVKMWQPERIFLVWEKANHHPQQLVSM